MYLLPWLGHGALQDLLHSFIQRIPGNLTVQIKIRKYQRAHDYSVSPKIQKPSKTFQLQEITLCHIFLFLG